MDSSGRLLIVSVGFMALLACGGTGGIEASKFGPVYRAGVQPGRTWMQAESPRTMADVRRISTTMDPQIEAFADAVGHARIGMSESERVILSVFEVALSAYQHGRDVVMADAAGDHDRVASIRAEAAKDLQEMYPAQAAEVGAVSDAKALVELLWQLGSTIVGAAHFTIEQQTGVRL